MKYNFNREWEDEGELFWLKTYKNTVLSQTNRPRTTSTAYLSPFPLDHPYNK